MKFESLSLEKFSPNVVENTHKVFGGADSNTEAGPGGCTCDTSGGEFTHGAEVVFTYKSDVQSYDANGNVDGKDYQNVTY